MPQLEQKFVPYPEDNGDVNKLTPDELLEELKEFLRDRGTAYEFETIKLKKGDEDGPKLLRDFLKLVRKDPKETSPEEVSREVSRLTRAIDSYKQRDFEIDKGRINPEPNYLASILQEQLFALEEEFTQKKAA